jgi:hypothetical protein
VVVAGDGSTHPDPSTPVEPVLRRYAAVIQDVTDLPACVLPLEADEPQRMRSVLRDLPADVGVIVFVQTLPEYIRKALADVDGVPVLTDRDASAIAITAALLATLTDAGRAPRSSRVVIAGANTMPALCPLLVTAGIGDITTWNLADALGFPLGRVAAGTDAVVDLLGGTAAHIRMLAPYSRPIVIAPDSLRDPLLALPGLLSAILRSPGSQLDLHVHHACALALVAATPRGQQLPGGPDRALTGHVADAATRAFQQPAYRHHDTRSG